MSVHSNHPVPLSSACALQNFISFDGDHNSSEHGALLHTCSCCAAAVLCCYCCCWASIFAAAQELGRGVEWCQITAPDQITSALSSAASTAALPP